MENVDYLYQHDLSIVSRKFFARNAMLQSLFACLFQEVLKQIYLSILFICANRSSIKIASCSPAQTSLFQRYVCFQRLLKTLPY